MDEQAFRNIGSALEGITTHTATASFITGSFSYTPDQMRAIITDFLDLANSYQNSMENAKRMATVEAPGLDYASEAHALAARAMGEDYHRSIEDSWRYCLAQAQKFQDTLDEYMGLEHRNVAQLNQVGPQGDQAGPVSGV